MVRLRGGDHEENIDALVKIKPHANGHTKEYDRYLNLGKMDTLARAHGGGDLARLHPPSRARRFSFERVQRFLHSHATMYISAYVCLPPHATCGTHCFTSPSSVRSMRPTIYDSATCARMGAVLITKLATRCSTLVPDVRIAKL